MVNNKLMMHACMRAWGRRWNLVLHLGIKDSLKDGCFCLVEGSVVGSTFIEGVRVKGAPTKHLHHHHRGESFAAYMESAHGVVVRDTCRVGGCRTYVICVEFSRGLYFGVKLD